MRKSVIVGIIVLVVIGASFALFQRNAAEEPDTSSGAGQITVFKSPICGCCGVYAQYLCRKGFDVTVNDIPDVAVEKRKYGVPDNLQSCHTSVIGGYVVEGHIPVEAINKLMQEKPAIKGIAMPGMQSGSPGMPGAKSGPFVIYAIQNDGTTNEFMRM